MLELKNVNVNYGRVQALRDVSLKVDEGEFVTVIGANGAGKTTTLRTISGLMKPTTGSIEFEGRRIDGNKTHIILGMGISQIPEGRELFSKMTVTENLELGMLSVRRELDFRKRVKEVFEIFPILEERQNQEADTLSGGEAQMLAIARGLMCNPKLLLLDEPSMGLAPLVVEALAKKIKGLHEQGMSIVLVEQNAYIALELASRVYVLEVGRVAMEGSTNEVINSEELKRAYLGI